MAAYYFDSSALVKCYAQEVGTNWVRGLINAQPSNEVFTALVTGAEIIAAIKRRERGNFISASDANVAIIAFRSACKWMYGMATETTEHFDRTAISVLSVAAINPIEIRFKEQEVLNG